MSAQRWRLIRHLAVVGDAIGLFGDSGGGGGQRQLLGARRWRLI
jgi:hypothetical protein